MTYSIAYVSQTGNTAQLAETIRDALPEAQCVSCGAPAPEAAEADLVFAGFWTDKGTCGEGFASFLEGLVNREVFLFGTAGFGGAKAYFGQILGRVSAHLAPSSAVIGTYMCQGKMPDSVRARYAAMAAQDPDKARPMLENFDRALSHPDAADLECLKRLVVELAKGR